MKKAFVIGAILLVLPYIAAAGTLPDTGQTRCYDNAQEITCTNPGEDFYGQDAQYGPNLQSYTKLDASGNDLPDNAPWPWAMVRDDVTGLIWEMKTDDDSIHDKDGQYSWDDGKNVFVATLNVASFGGFTDWHLPNIKDLAFIVNRDFCDPSINTDYFTNTMGRAYWSRNSLLIDPVYGTRGFFWLVSFFSGTIDIIYHTTNLYVRAVHGDTFSQSFLDNGDETITDTTSGLMWEKKADDGGMRDRENAYTWEQALAYCENLILNNDGKWTISNPNVSGVKYDDWRLPNINEILSIVDYFSYPARFPDDVLGNYWSSTTNVQEPDHAWYVYFFGGGKMFSAGGEVNYYDKYGLYGRNVRAVRGGGCGLLSDSDGDTICDDGDNSGTLGDSPCTGGERSNCDDNCPEVSNSDQLDTYPPQGNGIGDACECEGNFNCSVDQDCDGSDAAFFKADFGRNVIADPCTSESPCNGDFSCNGNVDGSDAALFKQDFGRSSIQNPCPACVVRPWCQYQ